MFTNIAITLYIAEIRLLFFSFVMVEYLLGEFKHNKMHGKGKMDYADGGIKEGTWSNNAFVG